MPCAEFSEDVLRRRSCEWERPVSRAGECEELNDMRNCASLVRPLTSLFISGCLVLQTIIRVRICAVS